MAIDTQKLRDLAGDLETYNVMSRYPQGLLDAADAARSDRENVLRASQALAKLRTGDPLTTEGLMTRLLNGWRYGIEGAAREEFFLVVDEFLLDMMRISEMRLEAKGRALGQKERALRAQLDGFLGSEKLSEPDELAARERP